MNARMLGSCIGLIALLSACGAGTAPVSTTPAQGGTMPTAEPTTIVPRAMIEPLELTIKDLTDRLDVRADEVELVSITTEEMPISDLGCSSAVKSGTAEPGGIVLGKEITLRAGGKTYVYRVYRLRVVLCEGTLPARDASPALPDASEVALEAALGDLSARLGVREDSIRIISVEKRMWSNTSLGCPQPGMMYAEVITPGFLIRLSAEGKEYTYHTSLTQAVLCDK